MDEKKTERLAYSIPEIVSLRLLPWGRDRLLEDLNNGTCPFILRGKRRFVTPEHLRQYIGNCES